MMKNTTVIYVQMIRSLCIQLLQEMDTDNINRIQKTARADCKENNGLRFTRLKGLKKNQQNAWLIFACHNLKKMSLWRGKYRRKPSKNSIYPSKYTKKTISFRKLPIYNKKPMSLRKRYRLLSTICKLDTQLFLLFHKPFFFDRIKMAFGEAYMKKTNYVKDVLVVLLGNFMVAVSVAFFVLPNNTLTGGVAGVAVALKPLLPFIPSVWLINILMIGLYIVGAVFLGKAFALKSLISTFSYSFFVSLLTYVTTLFPKDTFVMQPMLASIYCGLISGIGLGLCFRVNASTGGMDIPALLIHKYTHISSGNSVMIIDALTVLLGMSTYGVEPALIGVLSVFTSGFAIDKTILIGSSTAINCMVISDQWVEIKNHVLDNMKRGVTVLEGKGGYTNESKPVLMIVIPQKMYSNLEHEIMKVDPRAFIIVNSVHEVDGEGFTYELEDLK